MATFEEARNAITTLCRNQIAVTHAANSSRGVGKTLIAQERKAVAKLLEMILQRKPTDAELDEQINAIS